MKIREFIQKEAATFKRLDKEGKKHFIWDYYRIPIFVFGLILLLIIGQVIYSTGNQTACYAVLVNAAESDDNILDQLYHQQENSTKSKHINVSVSYQLDPDDPMMASTNASTMEGLATLFGVGDLDIFAADPTVFNMYAKKDAFEDLNVILGKEFLEKYGAEVYTYSTDNGYEVAGGIWLRDGSPLHKAGYYQKDVLIGIAQRAQNLQQATDVLKSLIIENND